MKAKGKLRDAFNEDATYDIYGYEMDCQAFAETQGVAWVNQLTKSKRKDKVVKDRRKARDAKWASRKHRINSGKASADRLRKLKAAGEKLREFGLYHTHNVTPANMVRILDSQTRAECLEAVANDEKPPRPTVNYSRKR